MLTSIKLSNTLIDLAVSLAKDVLPKLENIAYSSVIDKIEIKMSGRGAVKAMKGSTLFISNEDEVDINKQVNFLEDLVLFINFATKTVKHE